VNDVEPLGSALIEEGQRIGLDELVAAIAGHRLQVDTDDVEARVLVAAGSTTLSGEQIQETRFHRSPNLASSQRYAFVRAAR
jgi:hypothetical protein